VQCPQFRIDHEIAPRYASTEKRNGPIAVFFALAVNVQGYHALSSRSKGRRQLVAGSETVHNRMQCLSRKTHTADRSSALKVG
jgi:hypothetical protein